VPKERTFKGFVESEEPFFKHLETFGRFSKSPKPFYGFGKTPFFLECMRYTRRQKSYPFFISNAIILCIKFIAK
jgi:hypothetical protein